MRSPINISIPEPCKESWHKMTPVQGGRHCDVCDKCIVDFTEKSDREIYKAYQANERLCGKFSVDQLDRFISKPAKKRAPLGIAAAAAIAVSAPVQAESSNPSIEIVENTSETKISHADQTRLLRGRVFDNETKEPLFGATVALYEQGKMIGGAMTDFDGYFAVQAEVIESHKVDAIEVQYVGFQTVRKEFDPPLTAENFEKYTDDLAIAVTVDQVVLLGDVVVIEVPWHRRLWWKIRGLFR